MVYLIAPRSFDEIAANYSGLVIDSAAIDSHSQFAFTNVSASSQPHLYQLAMQPADSRYPNQLMDENPLLANYMPIMLQQGFSMQCSAEAAHFQASFQWQQTSPDNAALLVLRQIRHDTYRRLATELEAAKIPDERILLEQEAVVRAFQKPLMVFADSTTSVWAALVATRWVSLQNDYERVPEFLHGQCQKWSAQQLANPFVAQLCAKTNGDKLPVLISDIIPNFALPMRAGDTVLLQNLLGQKLTILDIWASWCMPCRHENRDVLAPLWEKYREQGLQIIGYSIDSSDKSWQTAIAKDGAAWPHASHLTGDETPFMEALRISVIPANFLLDTQGKVLAKNLHGEELERFVESYLKQ